MVVARQGHQDHNFGVFVELENDLEACSYLRTRDHKVETPGKRWSSPGDEVDVKISAVDIETARIGSPSSGP